MILLILACFGTAFLSYFIGKFIGYLLNKLWNNYNKDKEANDDRK